MPIRRAAATPPAQDKAPSAAAEKGEVGVVQDPRNGHLNAARTDSLSSGSVLCVFFSSKKFYYFTQYYSINKQIHLLFWSVNLTAYSSTEAPQMDQTPDVDPN